MKGFYVECRPEREMMYVYRYTADCYVEVLWVGVVDGRTVIMEFFPNYETRKAYLIPDVNKTREIKNSMFHV